MNLVSIIYNSFPPQSEAKEYKENFTVAPSYLTKCRRAIIYGKNGTKPSNPPDNASLFKMRMGDIIHDNIQELLKEKGLLESAEIHKNTHYNGLEFNYFYDGIINLSEDWRGILEIKTIYANGFRSIEKEPKPEHVLQCLSYMIFENIDKAIILYIGRDNGFMLQYELRLNNEIEVLFIDGKETRYHEQWLEKVAQLKAVKLYHLAGELPPRDYSMVFKNANGVISDEFQKDNQKYKSDWRCQYCSFKDICWAKELEEIKHHKFFIDGKFS